MSYQEQVLQVFALGNQLRGAVEARIRDQSGNSSSGALTTALNNLGNAFLKNAEPAKLQELIRRVSEAAEAAHGGAMNALSLGVQTPTSHPLLMDDFVARDFLNNLTKHLLRAAQDAIKALDVSEDASAAPRNVGSVLGPWELPHKLEPPTQYTGAVRPTDPHLEQRLQSRNG